MNKEQPPTKHSQQSLGRCPSEISWTEMLNHWRQGDGTPNDPLWTAIYGEVLSLAKSRLRREHQRPLQTSALAHECFIRLIESKQPTWLSRQHFFAIAGRVIRQVLVDEARKRLAKKRDALLVSLDASLTLPASTRQLDPEMLLALDAALDELGDSASRQVQVVDMRFVCGMTHGEIADTLDVTVSTVKRDLGLALAFLKRRLSRSVSAQTS